MLDKNDKKFISDAIKGAVETSAETVVGQIAGAMTKGFKDVDKRFDRVETRLDHLEKDVSVLKEDVSVLKGDMRDVKRRLTDLETDAPSNAEFQGHEKRLSRLEKVAPTS